MVQKKADRRFVLGSYVGDFVTDANFVPAPAITQGALAAIVGGDLGPFPNPRRKDDYFMPSAGVQYDAGQNLMLYASYSTGFKAGGYGGTNVIESFGPEYVKAYEIGAKGSAFDRALNFNLALFRSDYRDLQEATIIFLPSGAALVVTTNAASARSQGVEAGATLRISPALTLNTDVAYLDSKFRNYPNGPCNVLQTVQAGGLCPVPQNLSGRTRPFSPEYSGNVGATLTLPVGGHQLRIDPSLYFVTKFNQQGGDDPLYVQKGYVKTDLRVGFGPDNQTWEVALIGKNLTDKTTASYRSGVPASSGSVIAFAERGRSIALQFTIKH